ncbi:hypothetical protein WA026_001561 [Henosepilachna vigintioctopunctata]|uniref:Uncharacterized protein n=1 Tax=Henosepilachna vigintioctopunctata TaxID=420089 RepID=A0AAW1URJ6_9CUCU
MSPFLIILCVFVHCINLTSACGDHPIKYVISKIHDGEYTLTQIEQNVITSSEHAYSIKLAEPIQKLCKGLLNITHQTRYLYISEGLEDIEPGVFAGQNFMDAFFITSNKLRKLTSGTFENLTELNEIDLSDNEISIIEPGAFKNLPNLRILNLSKNKLSMLIHHSIVNTPNLVAFYLNGNHFTKLEPHSLSFLSKNKPVDLNLSQNFLEDIHTKCFEELSIIRFNISMNNLRMIPSVIMKNKDMELLDLCFNKLRRLPEDTYTLKKLHTFNVLGNPLDCVTQSKLRELSFNLNINVKLNSFC